jgi:SPP1 family predicted phage head-tail adaptor
MIVGKLRHRMDLQYYTETQDATYRTLKRWITVARIWGEIEPVKGLVTFDTKQMNETVTHKITIRYRESITTENWLYMDSRRFRVRFVRNLKETNRYLELLCEEDGYAMQNFETEISTVEEPIRDLLG